MVLDLTFTILPGPFDGVTTDFQTDEYYLPGSVRTIAPNLQPEACVTELGGKDVRLGFAPIEGDVVYLFYRPLL